MARRTRACLVSVIALLVVAGVGSQTSSSFARRALLVRGADSVRGLPFFSTNALAALSGAYSLDGPAANGGAKLSAAVPEAAVWYTREALVFGGAWKREDLGGTAVLVLSRPGASVIALKASRYCLFFEFPSATGSVTTDRGAADARRRAFIKAFDRKFLAFFENAAADAELSFPAYVDY